MKSRITKLFFSLPLAGAALGAQGMTLYVSPTGQASNNGLSRVQEAAGKGPLDSVQGALALLRASKAARKSAETDRIVLLQGEYRLSETIFIGPQDSGASAQHPLVIEAETPGAAVLVGSKKVVGFRPVPGKAYVAAQVDLPRGFHHLWINGQWAQRARSPNGSAFYSGAKNVVPAMPGDRLRNPRNPNNATNTSKVVLPKEAQTALSKVDDPSKGGVLLAMHSWTSSHQQIAQWDADTGAVTLKPESLWSFLRFGPDQRFALENLPEFLDEPGEWWAAPSGELRYLPRAGESTSTLSAEIPQLERLLEINGSERQPVQFVQIKGLRFSYASAWVAPFIDSQAATGVPAAVLVQQARSFSIQQCLFEKLGGHGLWLRQGSSEGLIQHNVFRQLGAGGIRIGEMAFSRDESSRAGTHRVEDNLIEDIGWLFPGAPGIWIGQSGGNRIVHNQVQRTFYTAISVGWTWGFGSSAARDNIIEKNWLKQIGQGRLSDLGGVYTLGTSPGTVIRGNRIEDVRSFRKSDTSAWGIYLDEGSSQILVEGNLINGTTGAGFHLHYGNNDVVRDNVFMNGETAQVRRSRRSDSALKFERNLLIAGSRPVWEREWADDDVRTSMNVIVADTSPIQVPTQLKFLQSKGRENESVWLRKSDVKCTETRCDVPSNRQAKRAFAPVDVKDAGIRDIKALPQ